MVVVGFATGAGGAGELGFSMNPAISTEYPAMINPETNFNNCGNQKMEIEL